MGNNNPTCNGGCQDGFYCLVGSPSQSQFPCPAGYYCPGGANGVGGPFLCPEGQYSQAKWSWCRGCDWGKAMTRKL